MTIVFSVLNSFLGRNVIRIQMPVDRRKATMGVYSRLFKDLKTSSATIEKVNKDFIKISVSFYRQETNRIFIRRPNGTSIDMPADLTKRDFKIIDLHLQAHQLTLKENE